MKKLIIYLFKFELMQSKLGRKFIGGHFYHIWPQGLQMANFWSDKPITSCQSKIIETEYFRNANS